MNATKPTRKARKSPYIPTSEHAAPLAPSLPAPVPASDATPHDPSTCWCGCGATVGPRAFYRPGHDSRHVGIVAREVAASDEFASITDQLPTKALQLKAWNMAYRLHLAAIKSQGSSRRK